MEDSSTYLLPAGSLLVVVGVMAEVCLILAMTVANMFHRAPGGTAIVRSGFRGKQVSSVGLIVLPFIESFERVDTKLKMVKVTLEGDSGVLTADRLTVDMEVVFFVRVNDTQEDVLKAVACFGAESASDLETIQRYFEPKCIEAMRKATGKFTFPQIYERRVEFRDQLLKELGKDHHGLLVDDVSIDWLEQGRLIGALQSQILPAAYREATVISSEVNAEGGRVEINLNGFLYQLLAKAMPFQGPFEEGAVVAIKDYDPKVMVYFVDAP